MMMLHKIDSHREQPDVRACYEPVGKTICRRHRRQRFRQCKGVQSNGTRHSVPAVGHCAETFISFNVYERRIRDTLDTEQKQSQGCILCASRLLCEVAAIALSLRIAKAVRGQRSDLFEYTLYFR